MLQEFLGICHQKNEEHKYEKVAFMGQVPVFVVGKVNAGDFIIASGRNDGLGIAISPDQISLKQLNKVVGIALGLMLTIMESIKLIYQ